MLLLLHFNRVGVHGQRLITGCDVGWGATKMKRVSQALQFSVVVEGGWPVVREFQLLQKLDLLLGRVAP